MSLFFFFLLLTHSFNFFILFRFFFNVVLHREIGHPLSYRMRENRNRAVVRKIEEGVFMALLAAIFYLFVPFLMFATLFFLLVVSFYILFCFKIFIRIINFIFILYYTWENRNLYIQI